jgi:V8-like Glu-specific endopeptidase
MAGAADYIGWKENGLIYYDIKTEHGQSGSPVMVMLYSNDKKRRLMVIGNFIIIQESTYVILRNYIEMWLFI